MDKVQEFIDWGLTRDDKPWQSNTARSYLRDLRRLEQIVGKPAEEVSPEEMRAFQAQHREENAGTWNRRYSAYSTFFKWLRDQGWYVRLDAQGQRRSDPSSAITQRKVPARQPAPHMDVLDKIADMPEGNHKNIAMFLYFSGLGIGEAVSVEEPPREGMLHVRVWGGEWEWKPVASPKAFDYLDNLGGRVGIKQRAVQRGLEPYGISPKDVTTASRRDFGTRTAQRDALGPVWELFAGREDLRDVARAYRDAVEELEGKRPNVPDAITDAGRALQEMFVVLHAEGNSLAPMFASLRKRGWFEPYDVKLFDAVQSLIDWVGADRSERGDAHKNTDPVREDADLALRIVAALLLRLEAMRH